MAGRHDALGDGGDLLGGLAGTENDLGKALSDRAVVVDPGEPEVLEGGLAQKLKEALVRSLRCSGPACGPGRGGP